MDLWLPPKPAIIRPAPETLNPARFKPASLRQGMLIATPLIGLAGGVASGITSILQIDSATSTAGANITAPATIVLGDLLLLWDNARNAASIPTAVTPTNFNNQFSISSITSRAMLSWKIADGSEANATITGMNGDTNTRKALYTFRGNSPFATALISSPNSQGTLADPSAQLVTSGSGTAPLLVFAGYATQTGTAIDPRSFTPAKDAELNATTDTYLAYKIYNSGPADVTVDMDAESGSFNGLVSGYFTFT